MKAIRSSKNSSRNIPDTGFTMPKPTAPLDKKALKFQMENKIIDMKREKQTLEKEFFKLSKRGIRKKVDLIRKT